MYDDVSLADLRKRVNDLSRQIENLARREVPTAVSASLTYIGTPTANSMTYWNGPGTLAHAAYGTVDMARYSGAPVAGNLAYWTAAGTIADSGIGTAGLTRYSGTPTANSMAYWTGNGTVAHAPFGTVDVFRTSGNQTASGIKNFSGSVGINEAAPDMPLHMTLSHNAASYVKIENTNSGGAARAGLQATTDGGDVFIGAASSSSVFGGGGFLYTSTSAPFTIWTNNAERIRVDSSGNIGIGTAIPAARFHVTQTSTTGAIPTLQLDQFDVSEEFIRFNTSGIGGSNPIGTVALGTYYGKVRVYVQGVGEKWLALYNT